MASPPSLHDLVSTPISALVHGEPDVRCDPAVIGLRKELRLPAPDLLLATTPPLEP